MIFENDLADTLARGALLAAIGLYWVVALIRMVGLRSLSKMTNFDFVMTIALGSLIASASQSESWLPFLQSLAAMAMLFFTQWFTSRLRARSETIKEAIQNTPVILMRNGEFQQSAMEYTRVSEEDIIAKLREANVLDLSQVRAVVLETTGDVSVLHGDRLEETLLRGVKSL